MRDYKHKTHADKPSQAFDIVLTIAVIALLFVINYLNLEA
jgi:hypothetical protein